MSGTQADAPVTLVNLTPHKVVLLPEDGDSVVLPPSGEVPRLILEEGRLDGLEVQVPGDCGTPATVRVPVAVGSTLVGVEPPLPAPRPGTIYVTSRVVAEHHPGRADLVWPDDLVRDGSGTVTGARRLASLHTLNP